MAEPIPTNTKNTSSPYKRDIFETYVAWRAIPAVMREAEHKDIADQLSIENQIFTELISIPNQTAFAKKYGVENSTLTNWNKLINKRDPLDETRQWAKTLTKNVLFALYTNIIETGNPASIKLWFEVVHGWNLKEKHGYDFPIVTEFNISLAKS